MMDGFGYLVVRYVTNRQTNEIGFFRKNVRCGAVAEETEGGWVGGRGEGGRVLGRGLRCD